jgi:hypothetical protein
MIPKRLASEVRALLAEHFNNPTRNAAREARAQYLGELIAATCRGDDTDCEAADWLKRLHELCGPHAHIKDISRWFELEQARLRKLAGNRTERSES